MLRCFSSRRLFRCGTLHSARRRVHCGRPDLVYVGGVMVLFLFVIMLVNVGAEERGTAAIFNRPPQVAAALVFSLLLVAVVVRNQSRLPEFQKRAGRNWNKVRKLGRRRSETCRRALRGVSGLTKTPNALEQACTRTPPSVRNRERAFAGRHHRLSDAGAYAETGSRRR